PCLQQLFFQLIECDSNIPGNGSQLQKETFVVAFCCCTVKIFQNMSITLNIARNVLALQGR
ncbi:MAG: hypothetical protein LBH28_06300, partial [Oscillospiraceae bacterium]|nr:hypothetical protein [Oscillospiraceae bacterium]